MDIPVLAAQLRKPEGENGRRVAENMNASNSLINLHAIAHLQPAAGDAVLEIGMGNGFFCKDVIQWQPDITYTGCDFSALMVAEASSFNQLWIDAERAAFYECEACALPFSNNTFDKVFTVNTIYFWEQPLTELAEIHRVMQHGGTLVIALRTRESMQQLPFTAYGFQLYEAAEVEQLLQQAGFTHIDTREEAEPPFEVHGHDKHIQLQALYVTAIKP